MRAAAAAQLHKPALFSRFYGFPPLLQWEVRQTGGIPMTAKEEFIDIYQTNIHREGADALLSI